MLLKADRIRPYLRQFEFKKLFVEEMGWDRHVARLDVLAEGQTWTLTAIAEKRGMTAFTCPPLANGRIPDYPTRSKIERQVAKSAHEHLIIYSDGSQTTQIWQWVKKEPGRPTGCREHTYHTDQPGDALIQKLQSIVFSLDEEENLTIVDVTGRVRAAFDLERVTKRFYDRFKDEHSAFLGFLKGIPDEEMQRWYASVMLNRLMFIYFIQKKGFLDGDTNYLQNKLAQSKQRGRDLFYSSVLCPLFFEGFAKKEGERSREVNLLLGRVPYLNGGLFMRHQIEEVHGAKIQLADAAFERLFAFFEQYQWNLDERPLRKDNEINPDVLGYIFEKYINQKQMGAYYTKEDITEYISKNSVIPYLFDEASQKCRIAFEGEQSVWRLLQSDPDRYIYPSVRTGVELALPEKIAIGLNDVSKRTDWNKPAAAEYALPTEIWREVVARRQRYHELRAKMTDGEITSINDLITYNLDIRQFAQDVIETCEGVDLLRAFWQAIEQVTVLDPTCGSGAFLFAALNILESLYEASLDRMEVFLADLDASGEKHHPGKLADFRKTLGRVAKHPNRRYFILKSIILNNLFGVDIMEEAVEVCKLRLFLKLVAQVERVEDIEPLPDIDFNIRSGNTLVGFASYDDVKRAVTSKFDFNNTMTRIDESARDVDSLFVMFRRQQTELGSEVTQADKQELRQRLATLEDELNQYLAGEYGVNVNDEASYKKWLTSHRPFHWFIEFYGIMKSGGFDAIIGNPPYVEYSQVRATYQVRGYSTESCGDLYSFVLERSVAHLLRVAGRAGMIVPVSCVSTDGFAPLQRFLVRQCQSMWTSNFAERPSKLFNGVEKRLSIVLAMSSKQVRPRLMVSKYNRWHADERHVLFDTLAYADLTDTYGLVYERYFKGSIPKVGTVVEVSILTKLLADHKVVQQFLSGFSQHQVLYTRKLRYFVQFFDFVPAIVDSKGNPQQPSELKALSASTVEHKKALLATLNSSLFFWFFIAFSDCRNVNRREIVNFPIDLERVSDERIKQLTHLSGALMDDFRSNSHMLHMNYVGRGTVEIQTFQPRESKPIIDEIDEILAKHYGLTDEETDFIINYDVKYRMGREAGSAEDEE